MNWAPIQARLGVTPDGVAGPITYAALLQRLAGWPMGAKAAELGAAFARHLPRAGIDTPLRLAHFLAQAGHETMGFRYSREIWGPTDAQRRYEGRADLGNTVPGDGRKYLGRGIFQVTGRSNYQRYGQMLGIDLACQPELAEQPDVSVQIACLYWRDKGLNDLADADDVRAITRKINGGLNGFDDRKARLAAAKAVLL